MKESFNKIFIIIEKISWIVLLSMICVTICNYFIFTIPFFDGAMNLQVAVNLLKNGQYAGNYPSYNLFPSEVQTGWPVLVPISILFSIFGISDKVALFVNSLYLFALVVLIIKINKRCSIPNFITALLLCWIFYIPEFRKFSMSIYGEIPTLAFILSAVYLLYKYDNRQKSLLYFLAGVLIGLAYSTKTVALIVLPSFIFVFFIQYFFEKKLQLRAIIYFFIGCLIPVFIFEIFKIYQLGFPEYLDSSIIVIKKVFAQAGVSIDPSYNFHDTANIFEKIRKHFFIFSVEYNIRVIFIILLLLFNVFLFILKFKREKLSYIDIITLIAFSYFIWWIGITPTQKAFQRRILIGEICLQWSTFYYLYWIIRRFIKNNAIYNILYSLSTVVCCLLFYPLFVYSSDNYKKNTYIYFADKIKELDSDKTFFCGFDWYQSPILSFYTGKNFCDLNKIDISQLDNKDYKFYLISSERPTLTEHDRNILPYATKLVFTVPFFQSERPPLSDYYKKLLPYVRNLLFIEPFDLQLYSVDISKPYNDFTEFEINNVKNTQLSPNSENIISRRIYEYEDSNKGYWIQNEASLLLKRSTNKGTKYIIKYYIPNNIVENENNLFQIKIGKYLVYDSLNETSGVREINIDIPNEYLNKHFIDFYFKTNIQLEKNHRDSRKLSLILLTVSQLEDAKLIGTK